MPEASLAMMIKAAGAVLGAVLALLFQPPRSIVGALRRVAIAITCGLVFHIQLAEWLGWPRGPENDFAAVVLASALSWWVFGALVRATEMWKGPKG